MGSQSRRIVGILAMLLIAGVSHAADIKKPLADTEGRRRAAENGLKQIKEKSPQPSDQVRSAYVESATRQNAWLDVVSQGIESASATEPNVSTVAQSAAVALVEWVNVRNRTLGLPLLAGTMADSVSKGVAQDLTDIAAQAWKDNRGADEKKRTSAVVALRERLRWRTWEELQ